MSVGEELITFHAELETNIDKLEQFGKDTIEKLESAEAKVADAWGKFYVMSVNIATVICCLWRLYGNKEMISRSHAVVVCCAPQMPTLILLRLHVGNKRFQRTTSLCFSHSYSVSSPVSIACTNNDFFAQDHSSGAHVSPDFSSVENILSSYLHKLESESSICIGKQEELHYRLMVANQSSLWKEANAYLSKLIDTATTCFS